MILNFTGYDINNINMLKSLNKLNLLKRIEDINLDSEINKFYETVTKENLEKITKQFLFYIIVEIDEKYFIYNKTPIVLLRKNNELLNEKIIEELKIRGVNYIWNNHF